MNQKITTYYISISSINIYNIIIYDIDVYLYISCTCTLYIFIYNINLCNIFNMYIFIYGINITYIHCHGLVVRMLDSFMRSQVRIPSESLVVLGRASNLNMLLCSSKNPWVIQPAWFKATPLHPTKKTHVSSLRVVD